MAPVTNGRDIKIPFMKIDFGQVGRVIRLLIYFLLTCWMVNYIMVHLPDLIRSLRKPGQ